jgi:signal transduction histidine kinase
MKPLRIRQWMFVGMLIILILPRLFYEIPNVLDRYLFERTLHLQQQAEVNTTLREVTASVSRWRDPDWQAAIHETIARSHLGILILDSTEHEIVRSGTIDSEEAPDRQASILEGNQLLGSVLIYIPDQGSILASIFAVIAAASAILFISFQMGRVVVKPLEAMSAAARRIADGDLDFELPRSTVMEVADVRAAFQAMGNGLQESLTRQSKLEEERRFFINAIAHDLRTPLFVLRGFLSRLERGLAETPEKAARYTAICCQKAEQLDHLVADLFSYAKMEYMDPTHRLKPVEFHSLLSEIVHEFRPIALEQEVEIINPFPTRPCMLQGDAPMLRRAVENLLDNALRHTPPKGKIEVNWQLADEVVTFTIADTGPGITDQDLPHVFDPFYRGDDSRNPEKGGTGFGLTIARRILRIHGGDLTAHNASPSGGAVFTGWIPCSIPK